MQPIHPDQPIFLEILRLRGEQAMGTNAEGAIVNSARMRRCVCARVLISEPSTSWDELDQVFLLLSNDFGQLGRRGPTGPSED
jgi:hypothetical protein